MTLVNLHLLDNLSRVCTYHEGVNHYLPSKFEVFWHSNSEALYSYPKSDCSINVRTTYGSNPPSSCWEISELTLSVCQSECFFLSTRGLPRMWRMKKTMEKQQKYQVQSQVFSSGCGTIISTRKKVSYTAVCKHHILCMSVLSKLVYIAGRVVADNDELTQVPTEGKRNHQDQS